MAGQECDEHDPCALIPCGVHGRCNEDRASDASKGYNCSCDTGWSGRACDVGLCASVPCKNGGKCNVNTKNVEVCKDAPECKELAESLHVHGILCEDIQRSERTFGAHAVSQVLNIVRTRVRELLAPKARRSGKEACGTSVLVTQGSTERIARSSSA